MPCELEVINLFRVCVGIMIVPRLTLACMLWALGHPWIAAAVWALMVINQIIGPCPPTNHLSRVTPCSHS